jgi:hypothetical protein
MSFDIAPPERNTPNQAKAGLSRSVSPQGLAQHNIAIKASPQAPHVVPRESGRLINIADQIAKSEIEGVGDLHKAREGRSVGAVLIFLNLLERDPTPFSERPLGNLEASSAHANRRPDRDIQSVGDVEGQGVGDVGLGRRCDASPRPSQRSVSSLGGRPQVWLR